MTATPGGDGPTRPHAPTSTQGPAVTETQIVAAFPGGTITEITQRVDDLVATHGPGLRLTQARGHFIVFTPGDDDPFTCWCGSCESTILDALPGAASLGSTMRVCDQCGNKRCPRAAHHRNTCTSSNEPGQPGSAYPHIAPPVEHGGDR